MEDGLKVQNTCLGSSESNVSLREKSQGTLLGSSSEN